MRWLKNSHGKYCFSFDLCIAGKRCDAHRCPGRIRFGKIFRHNFIDGRKMTQVGQVNGQFDRIIQTTASCLSNSCQIVEYLANLNSNIAGDQFTAVRIQWDLA